MKTLLLVVCVLVSEVLLAQTFEVSTVQDSYKGSIGELIKAPVKLKNNTNKPLTLILKRSETHLGTSQKSFFCLDSDCREKADELVIKIEPGQTAQNVFIGLEAGLVEGYSAIHYVAYNKSMPTEQSSFELNFVVEPRVEKTNIYSSSFITIHDVYPNPVNSFATIDYQLHSDQAKSKIIIHTLLGNALREYDLPYQENRIKILADDLSSGIYFYTLYVDNVGVMTRKLIVKK